MPYPLFRCACEIISLPLVRTNVNSLAFESARGKKYSIPIKLTNQIAYLCCVCNGDGHLRKHFLHIVDETKEHIQSLSVLFNQMFKTAAEIYLTGNTWNIEVHSSAASQLVNFFKRSNY